MKKNKFKTTKRQMKDNFYGYLFLAPWLIGFFVFTAYPLVYSLILSLTNYSMSPNYDFVGLQNYSRLILEDSLFRKAVSVTVKYVIISVPLQLAMALGLAMLLNKGIPGLKFFRAAYYLPALMGGSVAIAILWRQVFGIDGILNDVLKFLGVSEAVTSISWVASPDYSLYTLMILRVWQFGSPMLIFLAALKQVPQELNESAALDGANAFRRFLHITLPMISPMLLFNLIMQIVSAFQTFTSAYIVGGTGGASGGGGVANSLLFYTIYLYRMAFQNFKMGTASAMGWILVIAMAIITVVIFKTSKKWVHYSD